MSTDAEQLSASQVVCIMEGFTEPFTILLNDETFTVELSPSCYRAWDADDPDSPSLDTLYPELTDEGRNSVSPDDIPADDREELRYLKALRFVGYEKTVTVYIMMKDCCLVVPSRIDASPAGGSLTSHRAIVPIRRLTVEPTLPDEQAQILRARIARALPQEPQVHAAPSTLPLSSVHVLHSQHAQAAVTAIDRLLPALDHKMDQLILGQRKMMTAFESVTSAYQSLRADYEELERIHADGFLSLATSVNPDDFIALIYILALGNQKKAADALGIPHRSFYDRIGRWPTLGPEYKRMFRLVKWRKAVNRKIMLRLDDSLLSGEPSKQAENPETISGVLRRLKDQAPDNRDYPEVLRQLLGAMSRQNPDNWQTVKREVVGILTDELPQ